MIYLILSILSSTLILILFRLLNRLKIDLIYVIVLNYISASFIGSITNTDRTLSYIEVLKTPWFPLAIVIGIMLIVMFYVIGKSTQIAGVSVTSVASKMSVVLPMLFSLIYYHEELYFLKITGFIIALVAVGLAVYKRRNGEISMKQLLLPVILFFGAGILDSIVKFSQEEYIRDVHSAIFSGTCFTVAAITGIFVSIYLKLSLKTFIKVKVLITGFLLGAFNFGSMYFLILALNCQVFDSSIVFAVNNIGVVASSVIVALLLFSEKPSVINWIGIFFSFLAIYLLQF